MRGVGVSCARRRRRRGKTTTDGVVIVNVDAATKSAAKGRVLYRLEEDIDVDRCGDGEESSALEVRSFVALRRRRTNSMMKTASRCVMYRTRRARTRV